MGESFARIVQILDSRRNQDSHGTEIQFIEGKLKLPLLNNYSPTLPLLDKNNLFNKPVSAHLFWEIQTIFSECGLHAVI